MLQNCFSDVFEYHFAAASISNSFSPGTLFSRRFLIKLSMSVKKCNSLNLSLIGCFGPKASKSLTNPGKMILSRTTTVLSLDDLSGLSCLSESLATFPCSLCSELTTWLRNRFRKTKIMECSWWLSKILRTFRLVARFWSHLWCVSAAVEISDLSNFSWILCTSWSEKNNCFRNTKFQEIRCYICAKASFAHKHCFHRPNMVSNRLFCRIFLNQHLGSLSSWRFVKDLRWANTKRCYHLPLSIRFFFVSRCFLCSFLFPMFFSSFRR